MYKKILLASIFSLLIGNIQSEESPKMVFHDVVTNIRIEKIIEKLMSYEKEGSTKDMIDTMLEVKEHVQYYLGTKISITTSMDKILQELESKGHSISYNYFNSIKKQISTRQKRGHFHKMYIAKVILNDGVFNDKDNSDFIDDMNPDMKHKPKKVDIFVPRRIIYGFTLSLCGVFISSMPLLPDMVWGQNLIDTGVNILCESK